MERNRRLGSSGRSKGDNVVVKPPQGDRQPHQNRILAPSSRMTLLRHRKTPVSNPNDTLHYATSEPKASPRWRTHAVWLTACFAVFSHNILTHLGVVDVLGFLSLFAVPIVLDLFLIAVGILHMSRSIVARRYARAAGISLLLLALIAWHAVVFYQLLCAFANRPVSPWIWW